MSDTNLFDEGGEFAPPASLEALLVLAEETTEAEVAVSQMEEALSIAKKRLNDLKTKQLPELMASVNLDEFKISQGSYAGVKIKISDFCSGSLPKEPEAREKGIKWLEEHDGSSLIKTDVNLVFGRSEHNQALSLVEDLRKKDYEVEMVSGVHASTLQSFVREKMKNGEEVDLDLLGLYIGRVAKITFPKVK